MGVEHFNSVKCECVCWLTFDVFQVAYADREAFSSSRNSVLHECSVLAGDKFALRAVVTRFNDSVVVPRVRRPHLTIQLPTVHPLQKKNAYSTTKRKYLCLIIASILSTKCTSRLTFLIYQEIKQHFIILISLNFLGCCDC